MGAGWDVIVIGARCAGSPLAMLLARMGYRVMLADRGTFPSDTVSSHGLLNTGHARLHGWGLLDRLLDTGPGVGDAVEFHVGGAVIHGVCTPVNGISSGSGPRRHILDDLLVRAAAESGAEVRTGFRVNGLVLDGDRVAGVVHPVPGLESPYRGDPGLIKRHRQNVEARYEDSWRQGGRAGRPYDLCPEPGKRS